ncbi:family 2 glycosyl transferase (plasmid) [Halorientalis sp. IM1011]|uniref:glycosyltransferase family 2 protein n=1 Tax=Halorientalis sp. IM1011 TaxID=1932360 RepID=UPI00097CD5D4|nr:glycosyltransferase family 2 protein [Halorientalis sp. IM1011]AQL44934.1 family 2 glycosyl transferase [Halorientalis sp. IM1011]
MYSGQTVAVVVPAYNEEGFVGDVLDSIPAFVDRVYVVDDCSTDGTWREIRDHSERDDRAVAAKADGGRSVDRIEAIRHETNRGVGGAIKTGYRRALQDGMDVTAVIAGDGQMDPSILDRFVEPIVEGRADYTKGDRLQSPELRAGMSSWRSVGNYLLTFLTKLASGYWRTNDPQNGYTAISIDALERIDLDELYDRYGFSNDLLITLNAYGFRVADVPMRAIYGDEQSHINYASFVPRLSTLLFVGFLWRLKVKYCLADFHPLVFLYALGVLGGASGLALVGLVVTQGASLLAGSVSVFILLFSCALLVFAMIFDMQHNEHLEETVSY